MKSSTNNKKTPKHPLPPQTGVVCSNVPAKIQKLKVESVQNKCVFLGRHWNVVTILVLYWF